jgi:phosphatidylserine/phosphatidylglycerophosphate/cardiolipin synthase-like enzyme
VKVRVQAYYLTSPIIAAAMRRGLDLAVILDKSQDRHDNPRGRYTGATYLANAGVPVWIDDAPAIAHSKVIVLDDREVITDSLNFTRAADERNAENVVVLDSPEVASWFTRNWDLRRSVSRAFGME